MNKVLFKKELIREVSNLRERFGKLDKDPLNEELIVTLVKLHEVGAPRLISDIKKPFCLECLNNSKLFFSMILIQEANEFCCPNCGITIPRIGTETDRPIENPVEIDRRESFYDEEKTKKSYIEIERLLTKYKERAKRKRKKVAKIVCKVQKTS